MTTRSWSGPLLVALVASGGCENGNTPIDSTPSTAMTFGTPRTSVMIGTDVAFVLNASGQAPLAVVRIDFEGDGTWDETASLR